MVVAVMALVLNNVETVNGVWLQCVIGVNGTYSRVKVNAMIKSMKQLEHKVNLRNIG